MDNYGMTPEEAERRQRLIDNLIANGNYELAADVAKGPYRINQQSPGEGATPQEAWSRSPSVLSGEPMQGRPTAGSPQQPQQPPAGWTNNPSVLSGAAMRPTPSTSGPPVPGQPPPYQSTSDAARGQYGNMPYNQTQAYWEEKYRNDPQVQQGRGQSGGQPMNININLGGMPQEYAQWRGQPTPNPYAPQQGVTPSPYAPQQGVTPNPYAPQQGVTPNPYAPQSAADFGPAQPMFDLGVRRGQTPMAQFNNQMTNMVNDIRSPMQRTYIPTNGQMTPGRQPPPTILPNPRFDVQNQYKFGPPPGAQISNTQMGY